MLKIDKGNENQVIAITANERITKEDYEWLLPQLEQLFEKYDSLRFYIKPALQVRLFR